VNKTSSDKIKLAARVLIWFRRRLFQSIQSKIQPYLDSAYQLAFNRLADCDETCPLIVKEVAEFAGVAQETARQALQPLRDGGETFKAEVGEYAIAQ